MYTPSRLSAATTFMRKALKARDLVPRLFTPGIFRSRSDEALPAAVMARIREREWSSELLMRMIQLGIVTSFGILYFVSPRTDTSTSFSLVPLALSAYLALTLIGLLWSWRAEIPDWAAYTSIMLDVGLLMLLIWSFHKQYAQPASFYLKAPTFLYLFIFIALRALRFQPKFVVAAGVAAVIGWLIMVGLALLSGEEGTVITRDYVRYLTSNSMLIGAEMDKLLSVAVVTGILYLVLRRARALLVYAASEGAAAANLSRFFDGPVALQIRSAENLRMQGARREAAVLFVDLRDFTQFASQLEPKKVMRILGEYQKRIVPIIQANNGIIDKFLGDGVMATFGAAEVSATYAADALRAVDAIMSDVEQWPSDQSSLRLLPPRSVGTAVAAGTLVFGIVGDTKRLEFTVIGPAVNLAAKLEKVNKVVGTRALATTETYDLALRQNYHRARRTAAFEHEIEGLGQQPIAVLYE